VTKVSRQSTIHRGVKIGYCIYKVNNTVVLGKRHKEVLNLLKKTSCPVKVEFIDRGVQDTIMFQTKPLGFTVVQDKECNNAKVCKTNEWTAKQGVKTGSHIVAVNGEWVFGMNHRDICEIINNAKFPIKIAFRMPPQLQAPSIKDRLTGRNMGNLEKIPQKKLTWGLGRG